MTTLARRSPAGSTPTSTSMSRPPWMNGEHFSASSSFPTTPAGLRKLLTWLEAFGTVELVGVEGTGCYGAGLTRHLHQPGDLGRRGRPTQPPAAPAHGQVRPRRRRVCGSGRPGRRCHRVGQDQGRKRRGHAGVAGRSVSARQGRTQALNQMRSLISTAPDALRAELRDLSMSIKLLELPSPIDQARSGTSCRSPSSRCGCWPGGPSTSRRRSKRSTPS